LSADPFRHVPGLRQRIRHADDSELRVTPEVLCLWDERARDQGRPEDWRLSNSALEQTRLDLLGQRDATQALWIYAYGSLMWDPGFHFDEVRFADLPGHRRRFLFRTTLGRGSPQTPGLMLSLEHGTDVCRGLVFRLPRDALDLESACLWRREMIRGSYSPAWLPVSTPQGEVTALVFGANPAHPDHVGELPLAETAAMIAHASGVIGTNRDYLEQLVAQLDGLGIDDAYVRQLLGQVARAACA